MIFLVSSKFLASITLYIALFFSTTFQMLVENFFFVDFLENFSHQNFIPNLPDLYIYQQNKRTYFLSCQNIIQFGCLTLLLLWLVTILFYAAGLSLPRVFMAFSLLFPEKQTEKKLFFALLFYQENEQVSCQGSQLLL